MVFEDGDVYASITMSGNAISLVYGGALVISTNIAGIEVLHHHLTSNSSHPSHFINGHTIPQSAAQRVSKVLHSVIEYHSILSHQQCTASAF